jgi:ABC-type bacteriocin/lantibiotic exporter with double-glycine peptidase domain
LLKIVLNSFSILDKKHQRQFNSIFFQTIIGSIIEMFSVFILFQLVIYLTRPENFKSDLLLNFIFENNKILIKILFLLFIVYLVKFIYFLFLYRQQFSFSNNLTVYLSSLLLKMYLNKDFVFHNNTNSSVLTRNINVEVTQFTIGVIQQLLTFFTELFIVSGIIFLLAFYQPFITFTAIFLLLSIGMLYFYFTKNLFVRFGELRQYLSAQAIKYVTESLHGIKNIKIYSAENFFSEIFNSVIQKFASTNTKVMILQQISRLGLEFVIVFAMILFMLFNTHNLFSDPNLLESLGIFAVSSFKLIPSISKILVASHNLKFNSSSINLLKKEIDDFKNFKIKENSHFKIEFNRSIKLENVSYKYIGSEKFIFKNIDLEIKKGQSVGIMGSSGTGKSTLLNIIMGLLDPTSGKVLVDGDDIKYKKNEWLTIIGYVPQKIYLIDNSIKSNIAFGINDADVDLIKLEKAAKIANIYDFYKSLPIGVDTEIGELGSRISGGQGQRIGIARAFYKNSEIIVLDEATSSLDLSNENQIMEIIKKKFKEKTFIIVSHKKSVIENCDKKYYLSEDGFLEILV